MIVTSCPASLALQFLQDVLRSHFEWLPFPPLSVLFGVYSGPPYRAAPATWRVVYLYVKQARQPGQAGGTRPAQGT